MKTIGIDIMINGIKVIENNETRWILINDKSDIDVILNKLLKRLSRNYDNNDNDIDLKANNTTGEKNFYYDSDNKCLKSKAYLQKNSIIFNEKSILYSNKEEIKAFDIAIKPLVLKTIIQCSNNNMSKDDITKVYQFFIPSSHLALLSSFSKLSDDEQIEVLSLSKPSEIPIFLKDALRSFIELVLIDANLNCNRLRGKYPIDTLVSLLLIFSTNVFGNCDNDEFEFVAFVVSLFLYDFKRVQTHQIQLLYF